VSRAKALRPLSVVILLAAFAFNTAWLLNRWRIADRPPFKTLYESLIFAAWCIILVYLFVELIYRIKLIGFLSIGMTLLTLYFAHAQSKSVAKLPAALQSVWFIPHVVIYFVGYGALTIAFITSILYLIKLKVKAGEGEQLADFDDMTYHATAFGFVFLTFGLVTGAVWAKVAWSDYWFWDPKEVWSLITWLIYLVYLHLRTMRGWRGRPAAWFVVAGFLAIIITYLGFNYLPQAQESDHAYISE
ncbi:MAG: c-type cytochrome biogenesis protein CcsB, partial [Planctomycetes bacterium]|nr:c-type cytochrome biogenesis protein CcsB [Planctomycetota bacterium]